MSAADPLHYSADPALHWTTSNVGEAAPGVQTPLSWTLWSAGDAALREMAFKIGVLSRKEWRSSSDLPDRVFRPFYGRAALQIEFFTQLGNRLPGTSGVEVAVGLLGRKPDGLDETPTRRRYPVIAWRLPLVFLLAPRRLNRATEQFEVWYSQCVLRLPHSNLAEATAIFRESREMLKSGLTIQAQTASGVVQPLYDLLNRLVTQLGIGDIGLLSGGGGAELSGLVTDLWRASRDELSIEEVVRLHGFHGPLEGELSSVVWREDVEPLVKIVNDYQKLPDEEAPHRRIARRKAERALILPTVLAATPVVQRPAVRVLLRLAEKRIPLRGKAKRFMLQAFDVCRASARSIGRQLAQAGVLEDAEDVFFLTAEELCATLPRDVKGVVKERRRLHAEHSSIDLPRDWQGNPTPVKRDLRDSMPRSVSGVGVSTGVCEGVVRVVTHPDFCDVQPGEILVAATTDPSWSAVLMLSAALVVDIGGALSHAAVVARELGIPCVVNTRIGTRTLRTGDRVRVDGDSGAVTFCSEVEPA